MIETPQFHRLWTKRLRAEMWYSCVFLSAIIALTQFFTFQVDLHILDKPLFVLRLPYLFAALACLIILARKRNRIGIQAIQLTVVGLTLALLPYIWISQAAYATSDTPWIPFYGFQVLALLVAALRYGDGVRFNVFLLSAITIEAAAFWWRFHFGDDQLLAKSGYAWNVLLTGLCAAALLVARYGYERTLRRLIELEARTATAEMTAHVFLSVQDRANSPLQTLEIGLTLLRRRQSDGGLSDALLGALKKLIDLHKVFKTRADEVDWRSQVADAGEVTRRRAEGGSEPR